MLVLTVLPIWFSHFLACCMIWKCSLFLLMDSFIQHCWSYVQMMWFVHKLLLSLKDGNSQTLYIQIKEPWWIFSVKIFWEQSQDHSVNQHRMKSHLAVDWLVTEWGLNGDWMLTGKLTHLSDFSVYGICETYNYTLHSSILYVFKISSIREKSEY